jgi:tetratricopeptide (TPR) repeat protein
VLATYSKNIVLFCAVISVGGCASLEGFFGTKKSYVESRPIENPFGAAHASSNEDGMTLRSKNGDQSFEVQLPSERGVSDLLVPMSNDFAMQQNRIQAGEIDTRYESLRSQQSDREIAATFSPSNPQNDLRRHQIESGLGLKGSEQLPQMEQSFLAKIDVVKQLFRLRRFEAALIEIDQLVRSYPTNAKLYEMRGTVFDRLGYRDLAMKSWKQALEFQPGNASLARLIEKRSTQRSIASEVRKDP